MSESYDLATKLTAEYFLKELGREMEIDVESIRTLRRKGAFGDDFKVSEALIAFAMSGDVKGLVERFPEGKGIKWVRKKFGTIVEPEEIERISNTFYLGEHYKGRAFNFDGLWKRERPIVRRELLEKAKERFKLGVITGRSKLELKLAEELMEFHFENAVTRELYVKPGPPLALWHLAKGENGVYIGDTVNDGLMVDGYKKEYGADFEFIMIGRDAKDVNDVIENLLDTF